MSNEAKGRIRALAPDGIGLLVLLLALAFTYRGLLGHDPTDHAPMLMTEVGGDEPVGGFTALVDQRFVVWLVSRNARTWIRSPATLFQGEICHPTVNGLALGEPALTLGLLGVPVWLVSGDPILTYDSVVLAVTILAALAMYWLVRAWTGLPAAATVAALAYAFHPLKVSDPVHLYVADTAWLVFALLFVRRWFEQGRWRDALALAAACALQIGGSLYPLLASAAIGLPFGIWAMWRIGIRRTRPLQWVAIVLLVGAAAYGAFAPFVDKVAVGDLGVREFQVFVPWSMLFAVDGQRFGWGLIALALLAFVPLRAAVLLPDPRWALLAGTILVFWLATGGNQVAVMEAVAAGTEPSVSLPNLFAALATFVPGLSVVRLPAAIAHGSYVCLAILAGLGTARLVQAVPARAALAVALALVGFVFVDTLRPALPGEVPLSSWSLRPAQAELDFFADLEALGNEGPIVEVPSPQRPSPVYGLSILWSAYHHRPTSRCYNSFIPVETLQIEALARALPAPSAIRELREMGFETAVLDAAAADPAISHYVARFDEAARVPGSGLRLLHRGGSLSAWALEPAADEG